MPEESSVPIEGSTPVVDVASAEQSLAQKEAPQATPDVQAAPEVDPFAPKFAALSRKEKALQQKMSHFENQRKEWDAQQAANSDKYKGYETLAERIKTKPFEVMKEHGLTFEQLSEMALNDEQPTQDMVTNDRLSSAMQKIEALEARLAETDKVEKERVAAKTVDGFKNDIISFVEENLSEYELIKANGSTDLVYEVIEQHYDATNTILDVKDAADEVESYLEEQVKKFSSLDKVKKMMGVLDTPIEPTIERQPSPTLSNTHAATVPNRNGQPETREESLANAARLIQWDD